MPKLKTRKGIAKRVRVTRTGKLIRGHAVTWKSRKLEQNKSARKRLKRRSFAISDADAQTVRRQLGV